MKHFLQLFSSLFLLFCIFLRLINVTDGTIIVLHNNIAFTSIGTSDGGTGNTIQTRMLVNGSLTELIKFYEDFYNNNNNSQNGVVSFLKQPFNFVLGEYFPIRNFQEFNVDYPILRRRRFTEQNVYFPHRATELLETIYRQHPQRLFILSYDSCRDPIITDLLTRLDRLEIKSVCRLYNPFDGGSSQRTPLSLLLNIKDLWLYTHFLLFLSPYDVDLIREYLTSRSTGKNYHLYVSISPMHRGYPTLKQHQYQSLPRRVVVAANLPQASEPPVITPYVISKVSEDDVCKKTYNGDDGEQTIVISEDLDNFFINRTHRDRVSDMIRIQLRNQSCDVHSKLLESHRQTREKYIRVTSSLYYPYNVLLDLMPTPTGKCVEAGHSCYIAAENNDTTATNITWIPRCCDGISLTLFKMVAQKLNFKYDVYLTPDNKFGGTTDGGKWVGMIGDIMNGNADFAASSFNPTERRLRAVRFTPAYYFDELAFVLRRSSLKETPFVNWEFVRTMETDLAFLVLLSTVCVACFLIGAENVGFLMRRRKYFSTREVMTYIFGLTFQRDMGGKNPLRWAARIAALSYAAAMMIVMTTYTAHLTAKNIQSETFTDFHGLKDSRILNPTSKFKVSTMDATSMVDMFRSTPKYHKLWKFIQKYPVSSNIDGIQQVLSGQLDAYIADSMSVQTLMSQSKECHNMRLYKEAGKIEISYGYRKDLRLGELISQTMLNIRESEDMKSVYKKWIYMPHCLIDKAAFSQFDINYFGGILFIVGILCLVSIFLILSENFYTYVRMNRVHKHEDKYRARTVTSVTNTSYSIDDEQ